MKRKIYESGKLKCVVCGPQMDHEETLFNFPRTPERKRKWMDILEVTDIKRRSRVCQRHFKKDQFVRTLLKKGALPFSQIKPVNIKQELKPTSEFINILPKETVPFQPGTSAQLINGNNLNTNNMNYAIGVILMHPPPPIPPPALPITPLPVPLIKSEHDETPSPPTPQTSVTLQNSTNPNNDLAKLHQCRRKVYKLTERLKKAREVSSRKTDLTKVFGGNSQFYQFILTQIKRYKGSMAPYTPFEKSVAISLFYACGISGYRLLLSLGLKLPSILTVRGWIRHLDFAPGINTDLLQAVKLVTSGFNTQERDCVLTWGKTGIKELIEQNGSTDQLEGIVDLGTAGQKLESANEVLVFVVQGINLKWKFPISYYFLNRRTKPEDLKVIVEETLSKLKEVCDLNVRLLVCDMAPTTRSLYKMWNITEDQPYSMLNGYKVYCVHNVLHLLKSIRNSLLEYDFMFIKPEGSNGTSDTISWKHLVNFFNEDERLTTKMAPKLSRDHLFRKGAKTKLKLAMQIFSTSVFEGMINMIFLKTLQEDARSTANFVRIVDDMFDLLNMSKLSDDKRSRSAKYLYDDIKRFDEHIDYFKSIEVPMCPNKPECLGGIIMTLTGIKMLCLDLEGEDYKHVYTRQLQQDCLENLFSSIWKKKGLSRNPSAKQFRINFKYMFLTKLLKVYPADNNV